MADKFQFPYFDEAMIKIESCDSEVTPTEALTALKGFLTLTPEQHHSDGRHLVAYCKMMIDAVGEEEILEDIGGGSAKHRTNLGTYKDPSHIFQQT